MKTFALNDRVAVNDPTWHRHGDTGTVVKVNAKTIAVQMDSSPVDVVKGAPVYFVEA